MAAGERVPAGAGQLEWGLTPVFLEKSQVGSRACCVRQLHRPVQHGAAALYNAGIGLPLMQLLI